MRVGLLLCFCLLVFVFMHTNYWGDQPHVCKHDHCDFSSKIEGEIAAVGHNFILCFFVCVFLNASHV